MKTSITESKIERLEKEYGKFIDHKRGWLFFENGIVSSNEKVYLKTPKAVDSVLSHHSTKDDDESRYNLTRRWRVGLN